MQGADYEQSPGWSRGIASRGIKDTRLAVRPASEKIVGVVHEDAGKILSLTLVVLLKKRLIVSYREGKGSQGRGVRKII
jgi:hypothetical protein